MYSFIIYLFRDKVLAWNLQSFLPQSPECWDYRYVTPYLAFCCFYDKHRYKILPKLGNVLYFTIHGQNHVFDTLHPEHRCATYV
jgi:hypothetical protein